MPARIMEQVLAWVDRAARPVLVQLPSTEYDRLQRAWLLPERQPRLTRAGRWLRSRITRQARASGRHPPNGVKKQG